MISWKARKITGPWRINPTWILKLDGLLKTGHVAALKHVICAGVGGFLAWHHSNKSIAFAVNFLLAPVGGIQLVVFVNIAVLDSFSPPILVSVE